jgi:magnesium transporter
VYDHLTRIHASIEGIREMLATAIQVNLGMINLNETEVTKKLAGWAALIAVPTLIVGVYGMNFENMPELKWANGYYFALALMAGLDVALYVWFRRIRWL